MKQIRNTVGALIVSAAFLGAAATGNAQLTPHQAGPPSPQRSAAEEWVRYMNRGNQRAACELQTIAEVSGQGCAALPQMQVLRCPKVPVGRGPEESSKKPELRRVFEQAGTVADEGPGWASVVLNSRRKSSRLRGALGLEQVGGAWRVSYLRQGSNIYVPAGSVWMTETWRKLWYPPTCPR